MSMDVQWDIQKSCRIWNDSSRVICLWHESKSSISDSWSLSASSSLVTIVIKMSPLTENDLGQSLVPHISPLAAQS